MYESTREWAKVDLEKIKQQYRDTQSAKETSILNNYKQIIEEAEAIESSSEYASLMAISEEEYYKKYHSEDPSIMSIKTKFQNLRNLSKCIERKTADAPIVALSCYGQDWLQESVKKIKELTAKIEKTRFDKHFYYINDSDMAKQPVFQNGEVNPDFLKKEAFQDYVQDGREIDSYELNGYEKSFIGVQEPSEFIYDVYSGDLREMIKFIDIMEGARLSEHYILPAPHGPSYRTDYKTLNAEQKTILKERIQKLVHYSMQKEQNSEKTSKLQSVKFGSAMEDLFNSQSTQGKGKGKVGSQKEND